jgi:hypothetical protein
VWVTAHREEIPISELDNDHLVNILRLLERKPHFRQDTYPHIMAEAVKRGLVKPPATSKPMPGIPVDDILDVLKQNVMVSHLTATRREP